jgi:hypothetical protein
MKKHPPAPLRVTPPLLREGERNLWPGKASSTGALGGVSSIDCRFCLAVRNQGRLGMCKALRVRGIKPGAPRNRLCRAASAAPWGVTAKPARGEVYGRR